MGQLWYLDDIKKYKNNKNIKQLFSFLLNDHYRLIFGIFGIINIKFIKDNKCINESIYHNFIDKIGKNKELYILEYNCKNYNLIDFYEKNNISDIMDKISKTKINTKLNIELSNIYIDFKWGK